jgi:hypothetical protein
MDGSRAVQGLAHATWIASRRRDPCKSQNGSHVSERWYVTAGLELPVLPDAHAESPPRLSHRPARPLAILLEHRGERRHAWRLASETMSAADLAIGLGATIGGAVVLLHRGLRARWAKSLLDSHAGMLRRFPWLYGPKPLRDWMFSPAGAQQFLAVWAGALVLMGVVALLATVLD